MDQMPATGQSGRLQQANASPMPLNLDLNKYSILHNSIAGGKRVTIYTDKLRVRAYISIQPVALQFEITYPEVEATIAQTGLAVSKSSMMELNQLLMQLKEGSERGEDMTQRAFPPVEISVGKAPVHGKDGWFEWFVEEPDQRLRFKPDATGKIDYREMNLVVNVNVDDILLKVHPPTKGAPGYDVFGNALPAKDGAEKHCVVGKGVRFDEDDQALYADTAGHIENNEGVISVSPLYIVPGSVDFSVGNINFRGAVVVNRDVNEGFTVRATDTISVGNVAHQCFLYSGKDIEVRGGVTAQGGRGYLEAAGKVTAKYMVNARVECKGDVLVESQIVNCEITSAGKVIIPAGRIVGGQITALGGVECLEVGAQLGTKTVMIVSLEQFQTSETRAIDQELDRQEKAASKLENLLGPFFKDRSAINQLPQDKMKGVLEQLRDLDTINSKIAHLHNERQKALEPYAEAASDEIIVHKLIHPGVDVRIDNARQVFIDAIAGPVKLKPNYAKGTISVQAMPR
jgi:uncharacterized protein (DUF342 family)